MPNQVKDLTSDQLRRIFRDYLVGRPKEKLMKKYDISEEVFWEIVGMYSKVKHPNDVGNAQDIEGPADLLVTPLDTGSTATEHPIVARNPEDLNVTREQVIKEFDYDSPEEELRKKGGEVHELIQQRNAKTAKDQREEARKVIGENKEATDAILEELTETSKGEKAAIAEKAVERAKAAPSAEEVLKERNEKAELARKAEAAGEIVRQQAVTEHAEQAREDFQKQKEAGEKFTADTLKKQEEERQKADQRLVDSLKEATSAGQESAGSSSEAGKRPSEHASGRTRPDQEGRQPNVSSGSGQGAGSNPQASSPSNPGGQSAGSGDSTGRGSAATDRQAGGEASQGGSAVNPANTSPTAQPNPVEPAKVEPMGLKEKK